MDQSRGTFYLGQFVLDRNHTVVSWDQAMENFSGLNAGTVIGTSNHWQAFYPSSRSTLADFFLDNDYDGAEIQYGATGILRFPDSSWAVSYTHGIKKSESTETLLIWVTANDDGSAVQTLYNAGYLNEFKYLKDDRYQGMRILAEQVPVGVSLMQDGKMILINRYLSMMFGYSSPEEILNQPTTTVLDASEHDRHMELISNLHKMKNTASTRYQWNGVDKNGRDVWFEGQPVPIEWNGRPAVLSLVADITDFKEREAAIEEEAAGLRQENDRLKSSIACRLRMGNIIGKSQKMQDVYELVQRAAFKDSTVAIYGETGTGKELVAESIHKLSDRRKGPFVPVNCGAIPEELFESLFFGHKKGAFTGADTDKEGLLCAAHRGTLFLDEVAELSLSSQTKLLRALGKGEYTPVGCRTTRNVDFRLVAATNRNLEQMVREGVFRKDLFYRVHIIPVTLPPLRERKEDIPFLVKHFLQRFDVSRRMTSTDIARLLAYDWPGNVRELQNVLERYVAMGNLDFMNIDSIDESPRISEIPENLPLRNAVDQYERRIIIETLVKYDWNRTHAASALGLPRKTLFRKMKKHDIEPDVGA